VVVQVAALSKDYQGKVESMLQNYEKRKEQEAVVLARSERILQDLVRNPPRIWGVWVVAWGCCWPS
jgi:hypothetical protein